MYFSGIHSPASFIVPHVGQAHTYWKMKCLPLPVIVGYDEYSHAIFYRMFRKQLVWVLAMVSEYLVQ